MPSASARLVMVDAVPITVQCPALRDDAAFNLAPLSSLMRPVRNRSKSLRPSVPDAELAVPPLAAEHRAAGHHDRRNIGAGRAHQLRRSGLVAAAQQHHAIQRIGADHSSTSIAIRLRKSMVVGRMNISPSEMVGNSSGNPPAAQTPRFTASATVRRCALQLLSSLQELQMPMTGLSSKDVASEILPSASRRGGRSFRNWAAPPFLAAELFSNNGRVRHLQPSEDDRERV